MRPRYRRRSDRGLGPGRARGCLRLVGRLPRPSLSGRLERPPRLLVRGSRPRLRIASLADRRPNTSCVPSLPPSLLTLRPRSFAGPARGTHQQTHVPRTLDPPAYRSLPRVVLLGQPLDRVGGGGDECGPIGLGHLVSSQEIQPRAEAVRRFWEMNRWEPRNVAAVGRQIWVWRPQGAASGRWTVPDHLFEIASDQATRILTVSPIVWRVLLVDAGSPRYLLRGGAARHRKPYPPYSRRRMPP